jgi:hypothetical protein
VSKHIKVLERAGLVVRAQSAQYRPCALNGAPLEAVMSWMHHQWVDGDQVASFYDFKIETSVGAGSIPMAEWSVVRDDKLVSSRLVFDTAAMTALMPSS